LIARRFLVRLAAGAAAMLALGGQTPMTRPGDAAPKAVTLVAREFLYEPPEATAKAGDVTFVVKNAGAIEHNFVLQDAAQKKIAEIAVIEPGATAEVNGTVAPGTYLIVCSLPGHRQAGMIATLKVAQ